MVRNYLELVKVNFLKHLLPHLGISLVLCLITPFLMGVENLDIFRTARVLELYIALLGIIILIPIFLPEQNKDVKDLVETKYISMLEVHIIRTITAILCLGIFILGFLIYLKYGNCDFPFYLFLFGTISSAIFLGGMGIIVYALIDNIATAYMVPLVYYMINYGSGKKLGNFYLFSMTINSFTEKYYLFSIGVVLILIGLLIRHYRIGTRLITRF